MPLTPFHPVPVWLLWLRDRRLDFVALTVGSVVPDLLEPVFLLVFPESYMTHRDWSHSVLGALTYDLAVAIAGTILVARPLLGWLDRIRPSSLWRRFGGFNFRHRTTVRITILSSTIGTLSHILADLPFHATTSILFPGPRVQLFPEAEAWIAGTASAILFGPATGFLLYRYWWQPSREHDRPQESPEAGSRGY